MLKFLTVLFIVALADLNVNNEIFLKPPGWPEPAYNFNGNKLTKQKLLLGRVLFYDPVLSSDSTISCNSCHSPFSAFTHVDHALSHGIRDSVGTRNSPALMNLAWQKSFMWDGAVNNLDMQSLAPISHPAEMGSNINDVVKKLNRSQLYRALFYIAFKDSVASGEHTLKAIAQFMLSIVSANAKYDRVMNKKEQFSEKETRGYNTFKMHCASCHTEPLFTNAEFANNGIGHDTLLMDMGRMKITQNRSDALKFKVPTLRNIEYTFPYMHDGRFKRLSEVLDHYTSAVKQAATLSPQLRKKIVLNANDKVDLMAFLLTLSDKEFLFDPKFSFPKEVVNSRKVH